MISEETNCFFSNSKHKGYAASFSKDAKKTKLQMKKMTRSCSVLSSSLLVLCSLSKLSRADEVKTGWSSVDEFFEDHSAWIAFRKIVEPSVAGVGYPMTVKLEVLNLGKRTANDLTIVDSWDVAEFDLRPGSGSQPTASSVSANGSSEGNGGVVDSHSVRYSLSALNSGERKVFSYTVTPKTEGWLTVERANLSYEESPASMARALSSSICRLHTVSSARFSRMNRWLFPYWLVFVALVIAAFVYPLNHMVYVHKGGRTSVELHMPWLITLLSKIPAKYRDPFVPFLRRSPPRK